MTRFILCASTRVPRWYWTSYLSKSTGGIQRTLWLFTYIHPLGFNDSGAAGLMGWRKIIPEIRVFGGGHILMSPSIEWLMMFEESGTKVTKVIQSLYPSSRSPIECPVRVSQVPRVQSREPLTMYWSPGENMTEVMRSVWPRSGVPPSSGHHRFEPSHRLIHWLCRNHWKRLQSTWHNLYGLARVGQVAF